MSIWFTPATVADLNQIAHDTIVDGVGIEFTAIGEDFITARMPVDRRTVQPARILHGGASVVLAETLGSVAAFLCIDPDKKTTVGLEIKANHVHAVQEGHFVTGTVRPLHIGISTQIWDIQIIDDRQRLACLARITMAVLENRKNVGAPPSGD
jgi:1,4-dihydroxy-2-naphthoyl-CoA hydrolase